jgi:hypothetical protein
MKADQVWPHWGHLPTDDLPSPSDVPPRISLVKYLKLLGSVFLQIENTRGRCLNRHNKAYAGHDFTIVLLVLGHFGAQSIHMANILQNPTWSVNFPKYLVCTGYSYNSTASYVSSSQWALVCWASCLHKRKRKRENRG